MADFFLGADIGGTKTHALVADPDGKALGYGWSGPGNHQSVGYDGLFAALRSACGQALDSASIRLEDIAGAGIGIAGFDWPAQREEHLSTLARLGLRAPLQIVNDAALALLAGSGESWGIAIVAGTGCNCRGWNRERTREGRVTGFGTHMGEGAGSAELMFRAVQAVSHHWSRRGPATALSGAFINHTGADSLEDLIEGLTTRRYSLSAAAAPLVFQTAREGDPVAQELVRWAGTELGQLANAVARQLEFDGLAYDVVMAGSMFQNGDSLVAPLQETVRAYAPAARFIMLTAPPVVGGVVLGMEAVGADITPQTRERLRESAAELRNGRQVGTWPGN
jgi:N-acetylglucosamine kinase-like BadF-type ATPase